MTERWKIAAAVRELREADDPVKERSMPLTYKRRREIADMLDELQGLCERISDDRDSKQRELEAARRPITDEERAELKYVAFWIDRLEGNAPIKGPIQSLLRLAEYKPDEAP